MMEQKIYEDYTVLYCIVLYYAMLCCAMLCYAVIL